MFLVPSPTTKPTPVRIGFVADYCPICFEVRRFALYSYSKSKAQQFVIAGQKPTALHIICCPECGVEIQADLVRYARAAKKNVGLEELIETTQDEVRLAFAKQLEEGVRLRSHQLVLDERQKGDRLLEVLQAFNHLVVRGYANWSEFDRYSSSGCLGTFALFVLLFSIGMRAHDPSGESWLGYAFIMLAVGFFVTLGIAMCRPGRYVRAAIVPGVAKGFNIFSPSEDEVKAALERAKSLGLKIGKKVRLPYLLKVMREMPETSAAS